MSIKRGLSKYYIIIGALILLLAACLVAVVYSFEKYSNEVTKVPQLRAQYAGHLYLLDRCLDDGKSRDFCSSLEVTVSPPQGLQGVDGWQVSAVNTATDEYYGISVRVDYLPDQQPDEMPGRYWDFARDRQE